MRRTEQTRLSEFEEASHESPEVHESSRDAISASPVSKEIEQSTPKVKRPIWTKTIQTEENWGVCNLDGTVLLVQLVNNRIYAHGEEAVCKWCESTLVIRDNKIFCSGHCRRYQGDFSRDPNDFLRWEGAKSFTLRRIVAEIENLELEPRDLEPISYAPNWSILYEYEDEMEPEHDFD